MKFSRLLTALFVFTVLSFFGQEKVKTVLMGKNEFKEFAATNNVLGKAIESAFGKPVKQNFYSLEIIRVEAESNLTGSFQYYPVAENNGKKQELHNALASSAQNAVIRFRVYLDKKKSVVNKQVIPNLEDDVSFVLNVAVIGDPRVHAIKPENKTGFFSLVDEKNFADKAFKSCFGENPNKVNYNIAFDNTNACLVKDILKSGCAEQFDGKRYDQFSEKVTSVEYSSDFILIDLRLLRSKSRLTSAIEAAVIKEEDGSEHLRFYFSIPADNTRAKKKKEISMEGKIVSAAKLPVKGLVVYLRDALNVVIATQSTDNKGLFKFDKLHEGTAYSLLIDNSCKESALFLLNKKDEMIGQYQKTAIGFVYKLMEADLVKLTDMAETDPSGEFLASVKGKMLSVTNKISPICNQLVELKNSGNVVVQSQKTDNNGNFEFRHIDPKAVYSIELAEYTAISKTEKVYLSNAKNELVREFKKDKNNKFSYRIIPAEMHLLEEMNEEDVEMTFTKQKAGGGEIIISDFIYFGLSSSDITSASKNTLDKIAKIASENPVYKIEVISHTDCRGESSANQKLSEKRSEAVVAYLVSGNLDPKRLNAVGMGESKPLNSCVDGSACLEEEYKMNRRTEFRFYR